VPEWVPGGEPGCTLRAGIGQGRLDWQGAGDYAWDVVEGVGLPGAMAVDAIAGTNGTQQILDDAGTGTYLGVAFTSVATLGKGAQVLGPRATALAGRAGAGANTLTLQAFVRGQSWLLSGSPWARLALAGGYGANSVDNATLWLLAALGDCDAVGEWTALQQLGALDGPLPFGDVLAAGMLLPLHDLAQFRQGLGLLPLGTPGAEKQVVSRLDVGGRSFYGNNFKGGAGVEHPHLNMAMKQSRGHAEYDSFGQATREFPNGVNGGTAELYVDREPCPYCKNNLGTWSRQLGIDVLEVTWPGGSGSWLRSRGTFKKR
jgi:hypothetical protein